MTTPANKSALIRAARPVMTLLHSAARACTLLDNLRTVLSLFSLTVYASRLGRAGQKGRRRYDNLRRSALRVPVRVSCEGDERCVVSTSEDRVIAVFVEHRPNDPGRELQATGDPGKIQRVVRKADDVRRPPP